MDNCPALSTGGCRGPQPPRSLRGALLLGEEPGRLEGTARQGEACGQAGRALTNWPGVEEASGPQQEVGVHQVGQESRKQPSSSLPTSALI